MARNFPTFLIQDVKGAKSSGLFIVHLLEPVMIMKVRIDKGVHIDLLHVYDLEATEDKLRSIMSRAMDWYIATQRSAKPSKKIDLIPTGYPIKDAYLRMLSERGVYKHINLARSTVSNLRKQILEKELYPKDSTMKEQLELAGYICVQADRWAKVSKR